MIRLAVALFLALALQPAQATVVLGTDQVAGQKPYPVIRLEGEITSGDAVAFRAALAAATKRATFWINGVPAVHLDLDSPGGNVGAALEIGRLVRDHSLITRVMGDDICASACVFILQSGVLRAVTRTAKIGLHRPHFEPSAFAALSPVEARKRYNEMLDAVSEYWREMGGSREAWAIMVATPSSETQWIDATDARALDLSGEDPAWRELNLARQSSR